MKVGGSILKRIGIYFFCVVAFGCVTSSILYRRSEEANEIRLEKTASENSQETLRTEEKTDIVGDSVSGETAVQVSDGKSSDERFLVKEEEGYLVIYDRVSMKRYDETTIQVSDLPKRLQELIEDGLYFSNEEELYAFLENYSS